MVMESPLPLVSIIVCCYNRADMLPKTLESALAQNYPNTEIILYDDGSTDHTPELAAAYADRITYIRDTNRGIAVARTRACEAASGEFIAFLDDDDLMPPARISSLYAALAKHPDAKFAVGEIALIDQNDEIVSSPALESRTETVFADGHEAVLWPHVPATVHTTLFRRRDGEAIGWFDPDYDGAGEDKDFFARLGRGGSIVYIAEVVSLYRRGHSSLTGDGLKVLSAQLQLFDAALGQNGLTSEFRARLYFRLRMALQRLLQFPPSDRQALRFNVYAASLPVSEKLALLWYRAKQAVKHLLGSGRTIPL